MAVKSTSGFQVWLESMTEYYLQLPDEERNLTIDHIIASSGASQLQHLCTQVEQLFYRDILKLLPPELREHLLSFLDGKSLLTCCSVSRTWNQVINSSVRTWQQACRCLGLIIDKETQNCDGLYWKSYYLEMARRRHHMKTFKCFTSKTYERHLRRVTAVHYYNGKLAAASDSKIVQLWDCNKDQCLLNLRTDASVAAIKFDEQFLIASSYLGHMVSWDVNTGQRLMEYVRHAGAVFTFDFNQELDIIVSGSADNRIKVWSLPRGHLLTTLTDHSWWVLKVLLKPYPAQQGSSHQDRHLLFSMDKNSIVVWSMSFISRTVGPEGLYITSLYSIPVNGNDVNFFTPGLHFDGTNLFFMKQLPHSHGFSLLCKWDVKHRKLISETDLNLKIKVLLGVGKKYIAIMTPWRSKTTPNFIVMNKDTLENVALWHLPPSKPSTPDCSQLALGETSWLNGLDGKNDQGILLTAGIDDNSVYVVKWIPRKTEDIT